MPQRERRKQKRVEVHFLTSYRARERAATTEGFARTLNLSLVGVMIESPDPLQVGQELTLEFLMDNDAVAKVRGRVLHVTPGRDDLHLAGIIFEAPARRVQELLARQIP